MREEHIFPNHVISSTTNHAETVQLIYFQFKKKITTFYKHKWPKQKQQQQQQQQQNNTNNNNNNI